MAGFNLLRGLRSIGKRAVTTADVTGLQTALDGKASVDRVATFDLYWNVASLALPQDIVSRTIVAATARHIVDMTDYTEARLILFAASNSSASHKVAAEYSLDNGSTWNEIDGTSGPIITLDTGGSTAAPKASAWVTILAEARAAVQVRVVHLDGDSANDATLYRAALQLR
jgi:phosphoserine phosphatase